MLCVKTENATYKFPQQTIEEFITVHNEDLPELINRFKYMPGIFQFLPPDDGKPNKKYTKVHIVWDDEYIEILNDMYYIDKGVKEVAFEAIDEKFKKDIHHKLRDEGFRVMEFKWNDTKDKVWRFFMFKDPEVRPILEYICKLPTDFEREIIMGYALGYSNKEMSAHLKRMRRPQ